MRAAIRCAVGSFVFLLAVVSLAVAGADDLQLVNADDLATIKHYLAFAKFGHSRLPIGLPLSETTRDYFGKWNETVQQYQ